MDIDEPSAIAVKHLALELLALVRRWFRWRPVWIQHPQQAMDRAGIPGSPLARMPWQGAVTLFEPIQLRLNKAFYVCGAGGFLIRGHPAVSGAKELASRGNVAGNPRAVVAELLQMRPEIRQHRLGPRPRRPFALCETQQAVHRAPADHSPIVQPVRKIRLPLSVDAAAPHGSRHRHLQTPNAPRCSSHLIQVVNKLPSVAR